MKNYVVLLMTVCVVLLYPFIVFASSTDENYDFREDKLENSGDYNNVCELKDGILQALESGNAVVLQVDEMDIDVSNAVKVLRYNSEEVLPLLKQEDIIGCLQQNMDYCWKIPVEDRGEQGIDYAVAYTNMQGEWSYYTASAETEIGKNQVGYIFDTTQVTESLSRNNIEPKQLYAITVSEISMDCIIVDTEGEPYIIPYAARPDFFNLTNGQIYTLDEIYEKIDGYLAEVSYDFTGEEGGGAGGNDSMSPIIYVVISLLIVGAVFLIISKLLRNDKAR